jgi:DNA-binding GntR family transcriptional regulator
MPPEQSAHRRTLAAPARRARNAAAAPGRADQLLRALADAIMGGSHPVGSVLPAEAELAEAHGTGRAAVRAALRQLEALGLIARARGGAAHVIAGDIRAGYLVTGQLDAAEAGAYLAETRLVVERQRQVVADAELAMLLDAPEGSQWLHLSGLRLARDAAFGPLACADLWLAARAETVALPEPLTPAALEALLGVTIAEIEERIAAGSLTPAQARHLRARGGTACLQILRRYSKRSGVTVAALRDIHPAERIEVTIRLRRG